MRRSLLPTLLEVAASNLRFRDRVEVFEIGKVFLAQEDQDLPSEPQRLAIVVTGPRDGRHWLSLGGPELDFFDLKGVVEALAERLHISGLAFEEAEHRSFQPGRTALLRAGGADLGYLGEVHPDVRRSIGLPERRVVAAELDLDALLAQAPTSWFVESVSAYPAVLQDLAVVVDEAVPASTVHDAIVKAGGFLLKKATLFDVYRGAPVPEGKKSLAFGLAFQAPDKTLRESQVAKQVKRILGSLRSQLGAELRG